MGPVIGRRGDTLDAIQYLTSLVLNKFSDEHLRLTIDTCLLYTSHMKPCKMLP